VILGSPGSNESFGEGAREKREGARLPLPAEPSLPCLEPVGAFDGEDAINKVGWDGMMPRGKADVEDGGYWHNLCNNAPDLCMQGWNAGSLAAAALGLLLHLHPCPATP
jgi:hypothetical protein